MAPQFYNTVSGAATEPQPSSSHLLSIAVGAVVGVLVYATVTVSSSSSLHVQSGAVKPLITSSAKSPVFSEYAASSKQYFAPSEPLQFSKVDTVPPPAMSGAVGVSSLVVGAGTLALLFSSLVFKFFNQSSPKPQNLDINLADVLVTSVEKVVRLSTRKIDANTSLALMSVAGAKQPPVGIKSPVFSEKCDQTGITLTRFMLEVARANPDLQELESVFAAIQTACKTIAKLVKRSSIDGMTGLQAGGGSVNVQGEEQKKLDVITNDVLKRALKFTGRMGVIASEEEDEPVEVDNTMDESYGSDVLVEESGGKYISVFDPLDGSSNVDAGIPVGTIFGIFAEGADCALPDNFFDGDLTEAMKGCLKSTLQPGTSLVASGYALYSSATHFVFTLGAGVNGFTLDESIGEFILTHPDIKVPPRGKIYSINEANRNNWDAPMKTYIDSLASGENRGGNVYTSRYIGSMVGDVHRTLLYGGVFGYPADTKNVNGKLRLLYEAAPMSFLIEQAGGKSTTGLARIMDIPPKTVHQRVPLVMGGSDEIDELVELYEKSGDEELRKSQLARLKI